MRRILVSVFAVLATFSVLANNFIPVSAPASDGATLSSDLAPQGMARLSEQRVYTPAASVPGQPAIAEVQAQPDLAAFTPHTIAPEVETDVRPQAAIPQAVSEKPYVSAWTHQPATSFERAKLGTVPNAVGTEILSGTPADHVAMNSIGDVHSQRASRITEAEKAPILPAYVAAATDGPIDFFNPRALIEVPTAIADQNILSGANEHQIAQASIPTVAERTSFNAEPSNFVPRVPEFVAAAYQAPETIFQRARFVVEPTTLSTEILGDRVEHVPGYSTGTAAPERTTLTAEKAWLPAFVSTVSEITASVFGRERISAPADSLTSTDVLSEKSEHTAINETGAPVAERTTASAEKAWLPSFAAAVTEIASSVIGRETIATPTDTAVSTDVLASSETHDANGNVAASIERRSEAATAEKAPSLASFVSTIAAAPSAVFQKMGLLPMPEGPVKTETVLNDNSNHTVAANTTAVAVNERETATPDTAIAPVKASPVLISTETAMNANLLKPMSAGPLVNAPLPNENAIASTGYNATPFDRMIVTPDVPEAVLKAQPTLISSKTEFSNDLLKPMNAVASNPFVRLSKEEIVAAVQQRDGYCDPNFVGPPIRFSQTVQLRLEDLINQLHQRFGVNFILGDGVATLPLNVKAGSIPWNVLLRSQLFVSGVRASCIDANTIQLVKNDEIPNLQDSAEAKPNFIKLRFLQPGISQNISITGQSSGGQGGGGGQGCQGGGQGGGGGGGSSGGGGGGGGGQQGCGNFEKLIIEIEKILGIRSMTESSVGGGSSGGSQGGSTQTTEVKRTNRSVTVIPGRNILVVRATPDEMVLIREIIALADRPPFQVVIRGLVYTANEDKLKDIGGQVSAIVGTANQRTLGGVTSQPGPDSPTAPTTPTTPGQPNPGGVRTFGDGFNFPTGGGDAIFGISTIVGTAQFSAQVNLLQQDGVISVKNRPFAVVLDGEGTSLDVGRKIPIIVSAVNNIDGEAGTLQILDASNILQVIPQVVDDEAGNPIAVNLIMRLESNDVDGSVVTQGIPAIARRSIQSRLILNEDKTVILGGFTVDSDSKTTTKAPGLGDIPGLGWLFKRKVRSTQINRLYFALSVSIVPFGQIIEPVSVPGAGTDIPSVTPPMKDRSDKAEPKQVKGP